MKIYNVVNVQGDGFQEVVRIGQSKKSATDIVNQLTKENPTNKYRVVEELN